MRIIHLVIKLWKTQFSSLAQSGRFPGRPLGPLLKTGLSLMKNLLKPVAKSVFILWGLPVAAAAAGERTLT